MKNLLCGTILSLALGAGGYAALALNAEKPEKEEPKPISKIMKEAHVGAEDSLRAKVVSGKGTAADAKKLLALYEDLGKSKPPMGELADWKKKTTAIVEAAKKVAKAPDDEELTKALGKTINCKACHEAHRKPEKP